MSDNPQHVSVLMSAYQVEDYIAEAIESVLCQSYPHFELVIIDDASTDRTQQITLAYANQDDRIRLIRHAKNKGMLPTFIELLETARQEWVFLLDGDDRMLPERIERQVAFIQAHPELVLISGWVYYINARGRRIGKMMNHLTSPEKVRLELEADHPYWLHTPTVAFHRPTALKIGGYRNLAPFMDTDLYTRLALAGPALWQPEFLGEYRIRADSDSVIKQARMLQGFRWISAWMKARRLGLPVPDAEAYLESENRLPILERVILKLKDGSAIAYKQAVVKYSNRLYFQAFLLAAASTLLWPQTLWRKISHRKLTDIS